MALDTYFHFPRRAKRRQQPLAFSDAGHRATRATCSVSLTALERSGATFGRGNCATKTAPKGRCYVSLWHCWRSFTLLASFAALLLSASF